MTELQRNDNLSISDTAKGIAVRAGILSVAGIILGAWFFGIAAKAASGVIKILAGILLLLIGTGFATWEVKKVQRRFGP
jgi:hypothetical protein